MNVSKMLESVVILWDRVGFCYYNKNIREIRIYGSPEFLHINARKKIKLDKRTLHFDQTTFCKVLVLIFFQRFSNFTCSFCHFYMNCFYRTGHDFAIRLLLNNYIFSRKIQNWQKNNNR